MKIIKNLEKPKMNEAIKFRTEGIWPCDFKKASRVKYLISYFDGKIQKIYKVKKVYKYESRYNHLWCEYFKFDLEHDWRKRRTELQRKNPFANQNVLFNMWLQTFNVKKIIFETIDTNDHCECIGSKIEFKDFGSSFRYLKI
jgi:hypothetical protein